MLVVDEALTQLIQEQRLDDLQNVGLGGVVLPQGPAGVPGLHRLEQRPEDRRADLPPVEETGGDQLVPHRLVEVGNLDGLPEHRPVDVGEALDQFIGLAQPLLGRLIQRLVEHRQCRPQVGAVGAGTGLQVLQEQVTLPQPRIISEQREQGANQEDRGLVLVIARLLQLLIQTGHQLCGLHRGRDLLLGAERSLLVPGDEPQPFALGGEVLQGESHRPLPRRSLQVADAERGEITGDHVARHLRIGDGREIVHGLGFGRVQVFAGGLLLSDHHPRPEHVDEPCTAGDSTGLSFELRHIAPTHPVNREKVRPERLGLALLIGLPRPLIDEGGSVLTDLVPSQRFHMHHPIFTEANRYPVLGLEGT